MKHEAADYNLKFGMAYLMIEIYVIRLKII